MCISLHQNESERERERERDFIRKRRPVSLCVLFLPQLKPVPKLEQVDMAAREANSSKYRQSIVEDATLVE